MLAVVLRILIVLATGNLIVKSGDSKGIAGLVNTDLGGQQRVRFQRDLVARAHRQRLRRGKDQRPGVLPLPLTGQRWANTDPLGDLFTDLGDRGHGLVKPERQRLYGGFSRTVVNRLRVDCLCAALLDGQRCDFNRLRTVLPRVPAIDTSHSCGDQQQYAKGNLLRMSLNTLLQTGNAALQGRYPAWGTPVNLTQQRA